MSSRSLRTKVSPKKYSGHEFYDDDDDENNGNKNSYDIENKIKNNHYNASMVKEMNDGSEMTFAYFQEFGFDTPLRFKTKEGLG